MTSVYEFAIALNEKLDLENGDLKVNIVNIDEDYYTEGLNPDYWPDLTTYADIDNSGNVTVVTKYVDGAEYQPPSSGEFWQIAYFVDEEFVKGTKWIPIGDMCYAIEGNNPDRNCPTPVDDVPINISDVEVFLFGLNNDDTNGIQGTGESGTNLGMYLNPQYVTQLPGYESAEDYDFSNMYVKLYIEVVDEHWENPTVYEHTAQISEFNINNDDCYYYDLTNVDESIDTYYVSEVEYEFISPNVISDKGRLSHNS